MSLAHNPAHLALQGESACLQAFEGLRKIAPASWSAMPVCGSEGVQAFAPVMAAALGSPAADFPYAAIAAEAERPLRHGIRGATPLALLLLAGLVVGGDGTADGAHLLAQAALEMAARLGNEIGRQSRLLHTALVAPFSGAGEQALAELTVLCADAPVLCRAHLHLAGNGFMAGMALPELADHLSRAASLPAIDGHAGEVAAELALRACLLDRLMHGREAAVPHQEGSDVDAGFGLWLTRLQAAVYEGDDAAARHAAARADAAAGPLLPVGDRLAHHLFAALAWSQSDGAASAARLGMHCAALRHLAPSLSAGALFQCAEAASAWQGGDRLGALRGFDHAGSEADRLEQHALAALAWEQAARRAEACGLDAAMRHYRRQALAGWDQWGAAGRAAALRQAWNEDEDAPVRGGRAQVLRAGGIDELGVSIAHEVNQPLAAISLHAAAAHRWLRRGEPDIERALSSLSLISAAGRHAGDIVRSVQRLAAHQELEMGSVAVDQTIADTVRLLHRTLRKHGIEVELALALGDCTIRASRVQLQQVLTNLVMNATEALAGSGAGTPARRIRIASRRCGEREIEIAVVDNGPGIAPQHAGRVFGSMFSTKPDSTGMGLSISLAIVRAHGGQIAYEPCAPHGACFRFRLPVQSSDP